VRAPGFVQPFLVCGKRGIIRKVAKWRYSCAVILKQDRLKQQGADIFLIVIHNPVRK
jgi:hypothetical protein